MPIIKNKLYVNGNSGIPPLVNLKQFDKTADANGKQLQFALYDGATVYSIPSGSSLTIRGTKPDLTGYEYPCTFSGNAVFVNVQPQMTVCAGRHDAEIRVTKDNNIIGTFSFVMNVEASALGSNTPVSETDLPLIEQAAEAYNKVQGKVEEASASASAAKASADKASTSEKNAATSEKNAKASADASKASADASAKSANVAATSATNASGSATAASGSANAAASSATASANSASASADSAKKAEDAYKQASAIAGVGEFAYYVADDGMLHFKFKKGGI